MTKFLTIAYDLSAINNHAYFFEEAPENIFCKTCGCCIDPTYQPAELKTPNKTDIGVTYDRRFIASLRFKEYIDNLDLNVDFSLLNEKKTTISHPTQARYQLQRSTAGKPLQYLSSVF
ncbi:MULTISPECIES: hypothetical protein [Pseudomonas]|uniref:hypothetical protein n=1 Tax=Pseudomonas TaxID=286 RepID=UPI000A6D092F|nr:MULTISPECIES: hypothetical protein [Pseudomonas]